MSRIALLALDAVSHSYWRGPSEIEVLKDVSLEVHPGDLVGVYGHRRTGKTTLLRVAAGFQRPSNGTVAYSGRDLAQVSRTEFSRLHRLEIAWVEHGGPHVPELPVCDYVAMPLYGETSASDGRRRAAAALTRVGASDLARERWQDISDTARVLVAIAHAIVREPRLILVDDPTAGLGIIDREQVVGLLRSAAEDGGAGVLMAVPDMPAMLHASEARLLARGRLVGPEGPQDGQRNVVDFPQHRRA